MKFLIKKDLEYASLFKNLMLGVTSALFLYLILDVFLHAIIIGKDMVSVANTLYGNEEMFIEPILLDALLLQVHIDLFMNVITLMIIASIYIRFFNTQVMTKVWVHVLFITGLLAPIFIVIAYFSSEIFIYAWFISFTIGHVLGMFMSLMIVKELLKK